ncbi:uncharacterized protein LOC114358438 [Ostrinia furnacalis]|uniref:uncharacterized protein LOC114358438 n=1 Tax=Ostrinia furnacalis TaxID=93504 RepID=UPI00103E3966|nr:uncharacterized protein LOC114358438 [Ostrinia furnacalis]
MAVNEIIQKIYNLTSTSLQTGTPNEKNEILKSIETKLKKSSEALGSKASKYVALIMKGLQVMSSNNTTSSPKPNGEVIANLRNDHKSEPIEQATNSDLVKKIASKIFKLAEKHFRRAKTDEDKQKIIENIRQKVMETAKQKHNLIHTKHDEIKTYTDLITRGMELMMDKINQKKRRMIMEFVNSKVPTDQDNEKNIEREYNQLDDPSNNIDYGPLENEKLDLSKNNGFKPTAVPYLINPALTTTFSCEHIFSQTCIEIKSLNGFTCADNGITLPLDKLCNGVSDCSDGSDERNCVNEAIDRVHRASTIMSHIENYLSRKCVMDEDNALLMKQNGVLYEVLQREVGFIKKYKDMNHQDNVSGDVFTFKKTLNEVAIVIKTLAVALDTSICERYSNRRRVGIMGNIYSPDTAGLDESSHKPKIYLKSCKCRGSFCANVTCPEVCKRVCWHKHTLGKWSCHAVDESTAIPLDMVCDGKLDCYDESDESGCNPGIGPAKFEANQLFQKVLKLVEAKTNAKEYLDVKNKLLSLRNSIKKLQMEAVKPKLDLINVKNARDICFASLSSIYDHMVEKAYGIEDLEDTHLFFLTVNEDLMSALKLLHTGNEKIITPSGCYCRNGTCAQTKCTKACIRSCSVEHKLTRYKCKGNVNNNISVSIDKLCNGKAECPLEDDEAECSSEVCRKHHLVLLRHSIRDVGEAHKGTSLGEALRTWKTKVLSTLKIAENNYRPTRIILRDIINDVLRDLALTYATVEETRRNQGYLFKEFFKVSQLVMGAVKSCGQ